MGRHLLVHHDGQEHVLPETRIPTEEKLHTAFERHPELIPAEELGLGQLMVVGREVAFESGAADLICVDEGGRIVVIEVKKGTENPDSRRVVSQMLDYGAHLWGCTFEDFETKIAIPYLRRRWGTSSPANLRQAAASHFKFDGPEMSPDQFAEALAKNLEDGTFTYVVVARTIPPTLGTVLRYLGQISRVDTAAVTVDYYQDGDRHIMAPRVAFSSAGLRHKPPVDGTAKATPERFLQAVGPEAAPYWSGLVEYLDSLPGRFYWGTKGFSYRMVVDGKQYTVLRGYPRTVWWLLGKGKGDQLVLVTVPTDNRPESLRQTITERTASLRDCPDAVLTSDGDEKQVSFYFKSRLPEKSDRAVRDVLRALFTSPTSNPG